MRDRQRAGTGIAQEVGALDSGVGRDPENAHRKLPVAGPEHRQSRRRALVHRDRDIGDPHTWGIYAHTNGWTAYLSVVDGYAP